MRALLKYHIDVYKSSSHFVYPFLLILIYSILLHVFLPSFISNCFFYSMTTLFTACVANGFFSYKLCSDDMDAVLILKAGSALKYYLSKEMALGLSALVYTLIAMLYPGAVLLLGKITLSKSVPGELIVLYFLHLLVALLGYEIGSLFQPKIIRKRQLALILLFTTIAGILLRQTFTGIPILKYLYWIFPPFMKLLEIVLQSDTFLSVDTRRIAIQLALSILQVLVIKIIILNHRKWTIYE